MRRTNPSSEAGFTLVEAVVSAALLALVMIFVAGVLGAQSTLAVLNERARFGQEWADTGLSEIAARASRPTGAVNRNEAPLWVGLTQGIENMGNGTLRRVDEGGTGEATALQQFLTGGGYVEWTPEPGAVLLLAGSDDRTCSLSLGMDSTLEVTEGGTVVASSVEAVGNRPALSTHQPGDRYRLEMIQGGSIHLRYSRVRDGVVSGLFDSESELPSYPLAVKLRLSAPAVTVRDVRLNGALTDPASLADGGTTVPAAPCVAPYCDVIWRAPRVGAAEFSPQALPDGVAPPDGSEMLFVRRYEVVTVDAEMGLRSITMTLAPSSTAPPFLTRQTRVFTPKP
jgi:type II secretory pathway pseudopilin PulG